MEPCRNHGGGPRTIPYETHTLSNQQDSNLFRGSLSESEDPQLFNDLYYVQPEQGTEAREPPANRNAARTTQVPAEDVCWFYARGVQPSVFKLIILSGGGDKGSFSSCCDFKKIMCVCVGVGVCKMGVPGGGWGSVNLPLRWIFWNH